MKRLIVMFGIALVAPAAATAAPPVVMPGWPVNVAVGQVLPGPGRAITVVSADQVGLESNQIESAVGVFNVNGTKRWSAGRFASCGNCRGHSQPAVHRADGSIGPFGEWYAPWSVTSEGRIRNEDCRGLLLNDGVCVSHSANTAPGGPTIRATRSGTVLWSFDRPTLSWSAGFDDSPPPPIGLGQDGLIYTHLGSGRDSVSGSIVPSRLIALDRQTGALRWEADDGDVAAVLPNGIITKRLRVGVIRLDAAGHALWTIPIAVGRVEGIYADPAHGRVYFGRHDPTGVVTVAADLATGKTLWTTKPRDNAVPLSVDRRGTVYVAIARQPRYALRAIGSNGVGRWQWDTAGPVGAATALDDGTVAAITASPYGPGLMWRLALRRHPARPKAPVIQLHNRRSLGRCGRPDCSFRRDIGFRVEMQLPSRGIFRAYLLPPDRTTPSPGSGLTLRVPSGRSAVRVFPFPGRGRWTLEIRGTVGTTPIVRRFAVTGV